MKKTITFIFVLALYAALFLKVFAGDKTYCDGWKEGYVRGWCAGDPNCLRPLVPLCPVPEVNLNKYEDGFDRGFVKGKKDRKK